MPGALEKLIEEINGVDEEKTVYVIADGNIGFAIEVAEKMKIKKAVFWPSAAETLALFYNIQKIIDAEIIDNNGNARSLASLEKTVSQIGDEYPNPHYHPNK